MTETYTEIKQVWKYKPLDIAPKWYEEWALYFDDQAVAVFRKYIPEVEIGNGSPVFLLRRRDKRQERPNAAIWKEMRKQLGQGHVLFELSDMGQTSVDLGEVYQIEDQAAKVILRPDGTFKAVAWYCE